jgi:class 3 adenylate cyclase/TolB-like protein/Tfp pilus assembly protein PilF
MIPEDLHSIHHPSRVIRTVLVVDVVESVRLMEADEDGTVRRWRELVSEVSRDVLPQHAGRLVKSLGDGMMIEFEQPSAAVKATFGIRALSDRLNREVQPSRHILLRMGIHTGELIEDELDVYGRSVNLAARLTSLAGPGETIVSAEVHDLLTPTLDAELEDLGECYLKHVQEPVRAYRLGPPGHWPVIEPGSAARPELRPTIAVIPFAARGVAPEHAVLGEVLADEVISALSRTPALNVISRLSTTGLRGRDISVTELGAVLNANYVLSGAYRVAGTEVVLVVELADAPSGRVHWGRQLRGDVRGVISGTDDLIDRVVAEASAAILARELARAQTQALPTLESYALLMGAIALMHRLSRRGFDRSRELLNALIERAPRQAIPQAWLAKWHVLRVQQGWSDDPQADARLALERTTRAIEADPACSLAFAIDGFVQTNLLKRLDIAQDRYERAIEANPSDSLAWLLKGTLHAFKGEGDEAVAGTEQALRLSPLDPLKYFYDSLASTAALSAGQYERAIELAQRSLRANRTHTSTLRALAIAQVRLGRLEDARVTARELMRLEPRLTVTRYLERSPASAYETGRVWSDALRAAGVPE